MFDLKEFIVTNTVNGVKNGTFTKEYANIMAVNYMLKGVLTEDNVISINAQIEAWEAEKNTVPECEEPSEGEVSVEEIMTETTEEEDELVEDAEASEEVTDEVTELTTE